MAVVVEASDLVAFSSVVLLLLLNSQQALELANSGDSDEGDSSEEEFVGEGGSLLGVGGNCYVIPAVHHVRMLSMFTVAGEDLGYWVQPRSTTWFSRFVLEEFQEDRWVQCFRMTKRAVFSLAEMLRPEIQRRDTRYRLAIPALVRVCCTLFKLAQGCSIFICYEFFAVGKSFVSKMLRDTVCVVNDTLRHKLSWLSGQQLLECQLHFRDLYGMPGLVGAIDGMHVVISKPQCGSEDYYYFKSGGYSLNCQVVVDSSSIYTSACQGVQMILVYFVIVLCII
jgi:hypothetical protein